jgi:isoleucyl-tRNA synthetase
VAGMPGGPEGSSADWRSTLNLPETPFPMKADLPRREPAIQRRWAESDLYGRLRRARAGRPRFILHDGPPYVNGNVHMGTALNKSLKDFVVRFASLRGYDAPNVPGWDTHGLPVELQALRQYGLDRTRTDPLEIRRRCREFALGFLGTMTSQFTRLGILADWEHPYTTLEPAFEAEEIRAFGEMALRGLIYRGLRPVYWCVDCTTALAEAEVEFRTKESLAVTALFPVRDGRGLVPEGTRVAVWTTTPWTLPANVALAVHPDLPYVVVDTDRGPILVAEARREATLGAEEGRTPGTVRRRLLGRDLEGVVCGHPFLDRPSPIVLADYVTGAEGTGVVHTAPGHGREDFETAQRYGLPVIQPLDDQGRFTAEGGVLAGLTYREAEGRVVALLEAAGALWRAERVQHEYAHCWRCKEPLVWRATQQWFCRVAAFREAAIAAARQVRWHPAWGEERMVGMLRGRDDWCLSRQRVWGVPIPVLHCEGCGEPLLLEAVFRRIEEVVRAEGSDAWWRRAAEDFLPPEVACPRCGGRSVRKDPDILDVWFDSGCTHLAVLARRPDLAWPADLYLEGPDQFRGWFQSSLLTAVAVRGAAPYRGVVCNGWVLDGEGRAMHKSLGNVVEPTDLLARWGADVLRLWVASVDYTSDVRISEAIMAQVGEAYRKIRNTIRFLLGNLRDFDPSMSLPWDRLPERDRWALARLRRFLTLSAEAYAAYRYNAVYHLVQELCVQDLSSFYLDVAKDRLYCARADGPERRATQTALYEIARGLLLALAPILPHTADEAWGYLPKRPGDPDSVHLALWEDLPPVPGWGAAEEARWEVLLRWRGETARAVEAAVAGGVVDRPAQAEVLLPVGLEDRTLLQPLADELADQFLVAAVTLSAQAGPVTVRRTELPRCPRCWRHRPAAARGLCARCAEVVGS